MVQIKTRNWKNSRRKISKGTYAFFKLAIFVQRLSVESVRVLIDCLTIFSFVFMGVFIEYKMLNHENCVEKDGGD